MEHRLLQYIFSFFPRLPLRTFSFILSPSGASENIYSFFLEREEEVIFLVSLFSFFDDKRRN